MTEDSDSTESINVLFYIYFLIENISEFAIVCKTLCELSGDTADISVDIVSVEEVREHEIVLEREEEFTEEEIYISNLEFFMTFMTLLKLIAVKSGIDFEASIQRLFKK
jgi:hypothetical protein